MKNLKKAMIRRSIPTILSAVLFSASVLSAAPVSATELDAGASALDSVVDEAIRQTNERMQAFAETGDSAYLQDTSYFEPDETEMRSLAEEMPASFDLRTVGAGRVTPVKLQNPFGTCWGFSVIAAAESSILSKYAAYGQELAPTDLDLSEKHLAYFCAHPLPADSDTGQGGEGSYPGPATKDGYDNGGLAYYGTTAFASGVGPRFEEEIPYEPKDRENHIKYSPQGEPLYYTDDGDWSLEEEKRFGLAYELEESSLLPSPAGRDENGGYFYNEAGTNAIKSELMNGRAVSICFCADDSMPGQESSGNYINLDTWAHYTYAPESANHAVTIVGWDDAYDPSNFIEGHQPEQPGAWIVKNSWGAQSNSFPHKMDWGDDGYFYISYYDQSLSEPETFDFFIEDTGYDQVNVNQYDYMTSAHFDIHDLEEKVSEANVFRVEDGDIALRTVATTTAKAGADITYQIYRLRDGFTSPTDGILEATIERNYTYAGYHRADLEEPLYFREGKYYSVVVTQRSGGKYLFGSAYGLTKSFWDKQPEEDRNGRNYSVGVVNEGESFLGLQDASGNYEWEDWKDITTELIAFNDNNVTYDNFAIKAYADPYTFPPKTDLSAATVTLSETAYTYDGDAKTPVVTVAVGERVLAEGYDYTVSYQNNTRAGTATATVTAKDDSEYTGVREIDFTINKADLSTASVTLSETAYMYDGEAKTPGVTVAIAEKALTEGQDYTLSYQNNTRPGTATVTVTAKDDSNCTGVQEINFTINKADLSTATVTLSETAYTYDGEAKTPGVAVAVGEKALTAGQDYTLSYQNNTRAGTATVTVTAKDDSDYTGVQEIDFTINKADLSAATVALSSKTYTYNGRAKTPGVTVKAAGKTLVNGKDYTVSYKNNKNAGKAAVTVTAKNDSDYAGAKTTNFTINKAAQTLKLNVSKKNYKAKNLKVKKATFKIKPSKNKTSVSYKVTKGSSRYITVSKKGVVTLKKGAKKGTYKVTVTAKASTNYKAVKKTVTITVK